MGVILTVNGLSAQKGQSLEDTEDPLGDIQSGLDCT